MESIKNPFAAGRFYSSDKEQLLKTMDTFLKNHKYDYNVNSRAIIVPHAGYEYSGQLAFDGFYYLNKNVKNIFIIAPTHRKSVNNIAVSNYDGFKTPLGIVPTNKHMQEEIIRHFQCTYSNESFEEEHAIEVQIPFIQYFFKDKNVNIIPLLVGNDDVEKVLRIIKHFYVNPNNAFSISTDLSHFLPNEDAIKVDTMTASMIENSVLQGFRFEQACGAIPMCALSLYSKEKDFSLIRVGLTNSSKHTGDLSKVVGYGSWFLYEGTRNDFLQKYFSPKILSIAQNTIDAKLSGKSEINITSYMPYPPVMDSIGATFVTLEIDGNLRGCIGSALANTSILIDLIQNSYKAAFEDPRFTPLTRDEFEKVKISISLLSNPSPMTFKDENDLLKQLRPDIDGLIIQDIGKQALFLPSVWEQKSDKKTFLNSLKEKAGLEKNHFSKKFCAFRFTTNYIQ